MTKAVLTLAALPLAVARVAVEIAQDATRRPQHVDRWSCDCRPARLTHYGTACDTRRRRSAA